MPCSNAGKVGTCILVKKTIRHVYRSKQTNILNQLCHCESYFFGVELETAIAKTLEETSTYLPPQIDSGDCKEVFHSKCENLDKILTNIPGSNVVNSTAGIMLQKVKSDNGSNSSERTLPAAKRNKEQSLNVDPPSIFAPVTIYKQVRSCFPENALLSLPVDNDFEFKKCMKEYDIWTYSR